MFSEEKPEEGVSEEVRVADQTLVRIPEVYGGPVKTKFIPSCKSVFIQCQEVLRTVTLEVGALG